MSKSNISKTIWYNPLLRAVWAGNIEKVERLLQGGADPNTEEIQSDECLRPLDLAAFKKNMPMIALLRKFGAKSVRDIDAIISMRDDAEPCTMMLVGNTDFLH